MLKLKMMLCVMMLPLVVVGRTSKQSVSQCVSNAASGVDNAASLWLADTAERDYFTPRERLITMQKNNWKEPRSILMSSADRVAHRWATHAIIVSNTHALPAEYNVWSIKTEQSIYGMFAGFCFNNIFCAATNFAVLTVFFAQFRNEEMTVMVSLRATAAGLFWTVNVCWAHPVISRASAVASSIFSWCYSWCFWSSQNRMCRKLNKPKQWVEISTLLIFINVCQVRESSLYSLD